MTITITILISQELQLIRLRRTLKHVSVEVQIVVKTCQSGNVKYINYKTLKQKSKDKWKNGSKKTYRNDCEPSREETPKRRRKDYE